MASEMINRVLSAEKSAENAVNRAREEAEKILFETKKRIADADAAAVDKALVKAKEIVEAESVKAREAAAAAEKSAAEKGMGFKKNAEQKQSEVTKAVAQILIN
ncbi:MAG: hypothetical protein K6F09_04500 [Clostridiales bacterium]|nr:hypothetical protein [Clostridiales bacterium]